MATLSSLLTSIKWVLQDSAYTDAYLTTMINNAMHHIAAGIRMPNGQISPPLPDLYDYDTVTTSLTYPYVSLPSDYQRNVFSVIDSSKYQINPPAGGDYYSFNKFLQQISTMDMSESGSVYIVAVKGSKLYYQGKPTAAYTMGVHFYRQPTAMSATTDTPDGIPTRLSHLQDRLIVHYVMRELMGERIEDSHDTSSIGTKYHTGRFYEYMNDFIDAIGIDATPQYYGTGSYSDAGVCD